MEEKTRFAVGIDVGTKNVRAVLGSVGKDGNISVIGYGEKPAGGMRRGVIKELDTPIRVVDECLAGVEAMSGVTVSGATVSINGVNIASTKIDGMIAVGVEDHEIDEQDLARIEETAIAGKMSQSRKTLEIVPYEYILDGQGGIHEPLGMKGSRLELRANVISALTPDCDNLTKLYEHAKVGIDAIVPSVVAAATAVLTSQQKENGIGVVDMGDSTTSLAIYDEGELQYVGVVPLGSNDITKDLATVLMTVPEIAEEIKTRFASGKFGETDKDVVIKRGRDEYVFSRKDIDEVVEARLEEIFEKVRKHLKMAGYDKRLPEGLVLVGGGARLRDIDIYVRSQVELAVRIGKPEGVMGVSDDVAKPEYAAAVGLMLIDKDAGEFGPEKHSVKMKKSSHGNGGVFARFFKMFK